jgi:hypothetical protein
MLDNVPPSRENVYRMSAAMFPPIVSSPNVPERIRRSHPIGPREAISPNEPSPGRRDDFPERTHHVPGRDAGLRERKEWTIGENRAYPWTRRRARTVSPNEPSGGDMTAHPNEPSGGDMTAYPNEPERRRRDRKTPAFFAESPNCRLDVQRHVAAFFPERTQHARRSRIARGFGESVAGRPEDFRSLPQGM